LRQGGKAVTDLRVQAFEIPLFSPRPQQFFFFYKTISLCNMQLGYKVSKCIITESRKSLKNRLYEKKNGFEVIFLQEYFVGINAIITTSL
jgi:hypothetical protein